MGPGESVSEVDCERGDRGGREGVGRERESVFSCM